MNYAHFKQWVDERVAELVAFGVPRSEAEAAMQTVERRAITSELAQRSERQFLIDFKAIGAQGMAERLGVSRQTIWRKRSRMLQNNVTAATPPLTETA